MCWALPFFALVRKFVLGQEPEGTWLSPDELSLLSRAGCCLVPTTQALRIVTVLEPQKAEESLLRIRQSQCNTPAPPHPRGQHWEVLWTVKRLDLQVFGIFRSLDLWNPLLSGLRHEHTLWHIPPPEAQTYWTWNDKSYQTTFCFLSSLGQEFC